MVGRGINSVGIWGKLIRFKYIKNKDFTCWMRQGAIGKKIGSKIWNSFNIVKNILLQNISWMFGSGNRIILGIDNIIGSSEIRLHTTELINHLNRKGIFVLNQMIIEWRGNIPIWLEPIQLNLTRQYELDWFHLVKSLKDASICYHNKGDCITSTGKKKKSRETEVADCYLKLCMKELHDADYCWFYNFW